MQGLLDQSKIIDEIRKRNLDLFSDELSEEGELSLDLSESDYHIEQRLQPFIPHIKPSKTPIKKSQHPNFTYISPYSQKQLQERMSTSGSNHKQELSVRKKIFSVYNEQRKIQQSRAELKRQREAQNKKFATIKPRYLERQTLIKNVQSIEKSIYGRLKTETEHMRRPRSISKQQKEIKWNNFIKKSNEWEQARETNRIKAKINQNMKVNEELSTRSPFKPPPQATVDECLQKLRRQAEKLKEKLNYCTFQPKIYETQRNKRKLSKKKQRQGLPAELVERKFTVIPNPKKQLSFMFP